MKHCFAFLFLALTCNAYALFCPTNFNLINFGDTLLQVKQSCGSPINENTYTQKVNVVEEWEYVKTRFGSRDTIKIRVLLKNNLAANFTIIANSNASTPACLAAIAANSNASLTRELCRPNNQPSVRNVSVMNDCGGSLQLGDTQQTILAVCGEPIVRRTPQNAESTTNVMTELTYPSTPPIVLIFKNGMLTDKH